jgi:hypothetical protein
VDSGFWQSTPANSAARAVRASFGAGTAGDASIKSLRGKVNRIVSLGAAPNRPAEKLKPRALFIAPVRLPVNHPP